MSSQLPYNAPTGLSGSFSDNSVPLTWTEPTLNDLQIFTAPGTDLFTPISGYASGTVTVIGAGGGGGSADCISGGNNSHSGPGGGGGGYASVTLAIASILAVNSVTVGAGGAGGAAQSFTGGGTLAGLPGATGGASAFGALITAGGGHGGGTGGTSEEGGAGGTVTDTTGLATTETGGAGGNAEQSNNSGTSNNVGGTTANAGAGGAGGGYTFSYTQIGTSPAGGASTAGAGGVGGTQQVSAVANVNVVGAPGGNGATSTTYAGGSGGGGGGASSSTGLTGNGSSTGGAGGTGGNYGAGGGGGGTPTVTNTNGAKISQAGGTGAGGAITVTYLNLTLPLTGYAVFRDGVQIGTSATTSFTDPSPEFGVHNYTVAALSGTTVISPVSNVEAAQWGVDLYAQAAGNAGSDVLLQWSTPNCNDTQFEIVQNGSTVATIPAINNGNNIYPGQQTDFNYAYAIAQLTPNTEYAFSVTGDANGGSNTVDVTTGCRGVEIFNCDCSIEPVQQTLAELRTRVMIRLGYPNQAANPPPGMSALVDAFLYDAQKLIWKQLSRAGLNVERFFRWIMVPGQRYYGIDANADKCDLKLDPYKIVWAGFEDLNNAWYRLTEGVPPEYYTRANINFGWPTHYEVRSCIEIFPAPQAPYTLWIKGDFGLASFVDDSDTATIDDQAVFLLALGTAKQHYGQKDGAAVLAQADTYVRGLVAGLHGTRRYVPRTKVQNPATPPRFLPLGDAQA